MKHSILLVALVVACGGKLASVETEEPPPSPTVEASTPTIVEAGPESEPPCVESAGPVPHECSCDDKIDNDGDGLVDCSDPDCAHKQGCP